MRNTCRFGARIALIALALALAVTSVSPASGQEGYTISLDQLVVEPGGEQITAFVSVLAPDGRPAPGLTGFSATIDDTAAEIESIEPAINGQIPLASLLVIDDSGSMAGVPIAQAQAAASSFVQQMQPNDVAALLPFAGDVPAPQPFTSDQEELLAAIGALDAQLGSGTALYEALAVALETAVGAPTDRRAVVLLTDGRESGGVSDRTREEALQLAASSGIPVFPVAFGPDADVTFLLEAAEAGAGTLLLAPTSDDLPDVLARIGSQLRGQYGLNILVPESDATTRALAVRIEAGGEILTARSTFDTQAAAPQSGDGGSAGASVALLFGAVIAVLALLVGAFFWFRRWRRRRGQPKAGPGQDSVPLPARPSGLPQTNVPVGELEVVSGPNAGAVVPLASQPVDIGAAADCALRLDPLDGTALHHARVWLQQDRFVLHHLASGAQTRVGSRPVEWATLESDDSMEIGPHTIVVRLKSEAPVMSPGQTPEAT